VPSFQYGDRPYYVRVCRTDADRCTTVKVVSSCDCGIGIIDLSPAAFKDLAPLSVGRVPVTVTRVAPTVEVQAAPAKPGVPLPPTDTEP
jgi:rare lipoprotein A (peptidoglycan hydrolase)